MPEPIISVSNLVKTYKVHKKEPGFSGSLKSLFFRKYETVEAVKDISFEIKPGELIGFIGPNGAGKTTTLKCLSGLLYPSGGKVNVLGFKPFDRKTNFLKQIALVMGQKNQLWWDLPPTETFLLNKEIYEIPDKKYKETLEDLVELLDVKDVLNIQVRKLSLGQRMKCELIAALLHSPKVLFLDEPTIGLDVVMQKKLRDFLKEYNSKYNATIILTSHYMEDVRQLCERVIVIDHGTLLFDGKLDNLIKEYTQNKTISLILEKPVDRLKLEKLGEVTEYDFPKVVLSVKRKESNTITTKLLKDFPVIDLNIEEPDIEDIIREVFSKKISS
ncbi:MAG: ATP-binding cassette domain-containing protein [Candidatus Levybacteria bacterium]|nr:ATP-binding cassette domain-containing protein [Candidatus Levybacteria bacterium]MBP9815202.1 ATP-binding cassette domain-containing protein [Candidatus Levybacteria bacterium]